jgi:hypothetical protein
MEWIIVAMSDSGAIRNCFSSGMSGRWGWWHGWIVAFCGAKTTERPTMALQIYTCGKIPLKSIYQTMSSGSICLFTLPNR